MPLIAKLLNHKSLETTEIYAEMVNAALERWKTLYTTKIRYSPKKRNEKPDEETLANLYGLK